MVDHVYKGLSWETFNLFRTEQIYIPQGMFIVQYNMLHSMRTILFGYNFLWLYSQFVSD